MSELNSENFNMYLALLDAVPCIFFGLSCFVINKRFKSVLFGIGSALCVLAGFGKVAWKIVLALTSTNVDFLFYQLRVLMPVGFLLIIISLIINRKRISLKSICKKMIQLPSVIFFVLGILCMVLMTIFAFNMDQFNAKSNWIEEVTNSTAQLFIFLGICFIKKD